MKRAILLSLATLLIASTPIQAEIRHVPAQYATIQQAIDQSQDGDVVVVEAGTYGENINFSGKNIILTSKDPNDPETVAATIIDGRGIGSVVVFENGETAEAVLSGFTITGGYGTKETTEQEMNNLYQGAGIFCINASPTIKCNIITGNLGPSDTTADDTSQWILCYGGGIDCFQSNAIITQNIIKDNTAFAGGGIMTQVGEPKIFNNFIYNNSADYGGGIIIFYGGQLINNTIVGNNANLSQPDEDDISGGNIYTISEMELGQCIIVNNIICNAKSGGGILSQGTDEDFMAFNNVWNNLPGNYYAFDTITYDLISGGAVDRTGLDGNISQDPLFFRGSYNITAGSPCYDAGDPNYVPSPSQRDIHGEYAVMGARVDIGADEVTGNARPVADAGDNQLFDAIVTNVTLDGTNSYDFDNDTLSYQWRQTGGFNVAILNPDTPEPNFAPTVEDVYYFELTVFDGSNYSVPDSVMIVVGNRAPFADAGEDHACEPRQETTLDGSASYDLDEDDTLSYSWSQISGSSVELLDPNTPTPRFTPYLIGEYVFELIVNDGTAQSLSDTVTVICRIGSEPDTYGYHWIDSDSAWGPKYNWIDIQDTGTAITGLEYSFEESVGPFPLGFDFNFYGYIYKHFYVQTNGLISFSSVPVTRRNQQIPTADEYNSLIAWMWTDMYPTDISKIYYQQFSSFTVIQFVDYGIGAGGSVNAEVKIYKSGKIIIQYKDLSDDAYLFHTIGIENATGTIGTQVVFNDRNYLHDELAIEFSVGISTKPIADAGPDQHVAEPQMITLDGSGSFVYDPCSFLEYEWDQLVGPAVELTNPTSTHPSFMPEVEGEYRFELVVIGAEDFSEPDEVLILVGNQAPVADVGSNKAAPLLSRVTLDASGSYDPDLIDELSYKWTQLEGPEVNLRNADTATPYFTCEEEGLYIFEVVVSDGFVDSSPRIIEVSTISVTNNQYNLDPSFSTDEYFHYPDVSVSKVVYSVGQFDNYRWSIKCKDLLTGELNEDFLGGGINTQPKIDGDIVAWAFGPTSSGFRGPECIGIATKNIATGTEVILRPYSNTESYSHPAVSGNKVVWLEHLDINKNVENEWKNMPYSICGADITDMKRPVYFTIAEHVGRRDPYPYEDYGEDSDDVIDISGNIVVYEADGDIYGADISNINDIEVFTICNDPALQYDPAISGNTVVWTDERNDRGDVYGADISDTENICELVIVRANYNQLQPDIDSCLIVYTDGRSRNSGQIKVCCLTKQHRVMDIEISGFNYGMAPVINADTIVWQNSNYGKIEGISLEFAYSGLDGKVKNLTTGDYYDYIQHAIIASQTGDTIVASEGMYNESINFKGRKLTVSSVNPDNPAIVAATVINGSAQVVTFSTNEDTNSILSGFTITGGTNGIYCTGATPTISDCIITGNTKAGIKLYSGGNPTISKCNIIENGGAGIEMRPRKAPRFTSYNYPQISNSIIAKNMQQGILGGVPEITNCTIVENLGDGIYGSLPTVTNSIIYFNGNSIAESTATITYSDIQGSWPGFGNIDISPLFAFPSMLSSNSTYIGDYHLKSQAGRWDPDSQTWVQDNVSSPCIDKGDPASPVGDEPAPNGGIINMGAYGGTTQASMTPSE